jgi:hypothetical protein
MRQAVHPAYDEQCWIIEMADQTWAKIPFAWAVVVDDTTESREVEIVSDGLWVDVAGLLDLVTMVHHLSTAHREAAKDEPFTDLTSNERKQSPEQCDTRTPSLGAVGGDAATRDDFDAGDDVEPTPDVAATTVHFPEAAGGEE